MSIAIMSEVWDSSRLAGDALLMLLVLADHAGDERLVEAGYALSRIAMRCRLSNTVALDILSSIEKNGHITRQEHLNEPGTEERWYEIAECRYVGRLGRL